MTVKRAKQARKCLQYYRLNFQIDAPYTVLLDGNFLHASTEKKVVLDERLRKLLNCDKVNIVVTSCVCAELRAIGEPCAEAAAVATTIMRQKCGHASDPMGAGQCIQKLIGW